MFGAGGGLDPRKMQQMMKQMGIELKEIDASEVLIRTEAGEELVFTEPDVTRMDAQGQQTYQIVGTPESRNVSDSADSADVDNGEAAVPDEDVELVSMRTGTSEEAARAALEAVDGDLAAAVEKLE